MEKLNYETQCYKYKEYLIKITKKPYVERTNYDNDGYYMATIEHEDYGIQMTMFECACINWEEMEELIEASIYDYIVSLWETIQKIEADY